MNQDPIGFVARDSNLYRYAGNSPAIYVDPNGLLDCRGGRSGLLEGECVPEVQPGGPSDIPDRLEGKWEVSIAAHAESHAWLRFRNLETNEVRTLGRYRDGAGGRYDDDGNVLIPPASVSGVQVDQDLRKEDGVKRGLFPIRSIIVENPVMYKGRNEGDQFGFGERQNNCATFAAEGWEVYSGEKPPGGMIWDDPSQIADWINGMNDRDNGRAPPRGIVKPPSQFVPPRGGRDGGRWENIR